MNKQLLALIATFIGIVALPSITTAADVTTNNITNGSNMSPMYLNIPDAALIVNAAAGVYLNNATQINAPLTVGNYSQSIYVPTTLAGQTNVRVHPTTTDAINLYIHTAANPTFKVTNDGKIYFGAGDDQAPDTSLYRSAANTLQTANFNVTNALNVGTITAGYLRTDTISTGDSTNPLRIVSGISSMILSAPRGSIYLESPTVINKNLTVGNYSQSVYVDTQIAGPIDQRVNPGNATAIRVTRHTDANPVLEIKNDGSLNLGAGSNQPTDTNLYRPTANTLKTDDKLVAGGGLSVDSSTTLTLNEGAITVAKAYHTVDTEAGVSTDDLQTINGGTEGSILVLRAANNDHTVVLLDGNGNLKLRGDFSLDTTEDTITLIFDGTFWMEISRSGNAS